MEAASVELGQRKEAERMEFKAAAAESSIKSNRPRRRVQWLLGGVLVWGAISVIYACSVYMEATRPEPVDVAKFAVGDSRNTVRTDLGQPALTTNENGNECDTYHLYTHAVGAAGRAPIAIAETAADVFTLGLAEAVLTPTEMVTRNAKYPVKFCYKDNKLIQVTEDPNPVSAQ
jgi:hypothetical protein